ncbi:MAG: discoidin domain-containing protein [Candidatus Binatia bacterium]
MIGLDGPEGRADRASLASLIGAIALGLAIRIALAFAADGKSWSDNAIIALMAMHALSGKFYPFYWGQTYMGSLEAVVVAPFFALFGVSDVTLSIGLLPWYVLFAVALHRVAARCAGRLAGDIVPWLLAIAPPYVQYQHIAARGGYTETLAFGTVLLWLVLRVTHDALPANSERRHLHAIAFVAGLAFWTNWLIFPYFAVAAVYLWLHDRRLPLRPVIVSMLAFFLLGSLPFWVFNIRHGFPTFSFVADVQTPESRALAFEFALRDAIPQLLGFRDLDGRFVHGWLGAALTAGSAVATAALVVGLHRSWAALLHGRVRQSEPMLALVLLVAAMVAIYSVGLPGRFHVARYLLPIATSTLVLVAAAVAWLLNRSRALGVAALSGLALLYGLQIFAFGEGFAQRRGRPGAGHVDQLAPALLQAGIRFGYADYGDATITTYLTRDRVVLTDYPGLRYPLDEVDFRDPAVIVRKGMPPAEPTLAALNARASSNRTAGYTIHWPIRYDGVSRAPMPRGGWTITASVDDAAAANMLDGDLWTYWSVPAKTAEPSITLDLGRLVTANGLFLEGGERGHDGFVRLRIESSGDGLDWHLVKEAKAGLPLFFERSGQITTVGRTRQDVLFPPVGARFLRLTLLEGDRKYAWSVAELGVFGPGSEGAPFVEPEFADPMSPTFVERRLRSQSLREPESHVPLLQLRRLYQSLGEAGNVREIERLETAGFQPQERLDWRFGADLKFLGYDWRALGPRRVEITYHWQAMRPMDEAYASYVRLRSADQTLADDSVLGMTHTTARWIRGEVVKDRRVLALASDGTYEATIGVWAPRSRRHLRVGRWWGPRTAPFCRIVAAAETVTVESIH